MSTLTVKIGPNDKEIRLTARTPRAVVAAARAVTPNLDVEDLRALSAWTKRCREDDWFSYGADWKAQAFVSIVGIVAIWIACAVVDVDVPESIDDATDMDFVRRVWKMTPRVKSVAS